MKEDSGLGPVLELRDDLEDSDTGASPVVVEGGWTPKKSPPSSETPPGATPQERVKSEPQASSIPAIVTSESSPTPEPSVAEAGVVPESLVEPSINDTEGVPETVAVEVVTAEPVAVEAISDAAVAEMSIEKEDGSSTSSSPGLQDEILKLASYADLFDRMLEYAFIIDTESMYVLASNPSAERELGMTTEVFKGKGLQDFVLEEHKEEFVKKLRKAKRSYYLFEFDANWKTADNTSKILNFAACKLKLKNEQEVLQIIARDVTELREAQARLKNMATTDEMTKLPNFRKFKEQLTAEHERCTRYGKEYAIVFCDVDNFKHYNDRNGHPAGDELLKEVAKVMMKCVRNTDLPARYGGEEFVVLCPEVNWKDSLVLAERIRTTLCEGKFAHSEAQPLGYLSVSIGVASFPADGKTVEEVLHAADQALYVSKKSGRNRVTPHQSLQEKKMKIVSPPPFKPKAS